jgi:hypothetical protein
MVVFGVYFFRELLNGRPEECQARMANDARTICGIDGHRTGTRCASTMSSGDRLYLE